ncbi:MAG: MFS transporter [Fibrobacteres bacterium]|jgi:predicted MFS family arabinose efflux permease|nr:MFS transporter [Fibrobacterota bacterium]
MTYLGQTMPSLISRFRALPPDLRNFLLALATFGFAMSLFDAIFNNFLDARFQPSGFQRTLLEVPREIPGLSVVFVSAILAFLPSRRLAVLASVLSGLGLVLLGTLSSTFYWMMPWLFLYSMGQHLFMPISQAIGMELSKDGQSGKRLGQMSALRNATAIAGSALVFVGFQFFQMGFLTTLILAAASLLVAGWFFWRMTPDLPQPQKAHLRLHKEYRLYYLLAILFGTRKQLFLTFAPWVLVTIFEQPTSMIAKLLTIGGVVGIAIQPLVGKMIDAKGERFALSLEAILLAFVCAGYALSKGFFPPTVALVLVAVCFLLDQILMSFNIARSTYLKKIALEPSHITPTLTMAVSIDHIFSISIALLGGLLWRHLGYQSVFIAGIALSAGNWFAARRMRH